MLRFGTVVNGFQRIDRLDTPRVMIWLEPSRPDVTRFGWEIGTYGAGLFVERLMLALPATTK